MSAEQNEKLSCRRDCQYCTFVVMGASGDLAKRKIYPALYSLYKENLFPKNWNVVGYARSDLTTESIKERVKPFILKIEKDEKKIDEFFKKTSYVNGHYDSDEDFHKLDDYLKQLESASGCCQTNRLFHLSLPPSVFSIVTEKIGTICKTETGWTRLIIEKPFGKNQQSFKELSKHIHQFFTSEELFMIDHYIGKEVVQALNALRFGNVIFDPLWNRNSIKCIQIINKETLGVEGRGGYFDEFGIIRDIMQNHLMQILTLICMEPPVSLNSEDIVEEKVKILKSIRPITLKEAVIGQYVAAGDKPGYLDDPTVPKDSITPTFCAAVAKIENRRWDGVPILFKAGKGLDSNSVEVRIQFHEVPASIYTTSKLSPNELVIRIQPNEALYFNIMNKVTGYGEQLTKTKLDFSYSNLPNAAPIPDAYARLIKAVIQNDKRYFVNEKELDLSWKVWDTLLSDMENQKIQPENYKFGSVGPISSFNLAAKHQCSWED